MRHLCYGTGACVIFGARLAALRLKLLPGRMVEPLPDQCTVGTSRQLRSIWLNVIIEMPVRFTPALY